MICSKTLVRFNRINYGKISLALFVQFAIQNTILERCFAIEPGYYLNDPVEVELDTLFSKADRTIYCLDWDQVHITPDLTSHNDKRSVMHCSELRKILLRDKKKNLLIIVLEKGIAPTRTTEVTEKLADFVKELGFTRVLIVGASGAGTHVFKDLVFKQKASR